MNPVVGAALDSWSPRWPVLFLCGLIALLYIRGWVRRRRLVHSPTDANRITAFVSGMIVLAIALESPLDALDGLFLSAHMAQHLLLLMVAPPLLLLGQPGIPLLTALPKAFVREAIAPFLHAPGLRKLTHYLTAMPFSWLLFALSTLVWHMPRFYELAVHSPAWHGVQHACFFWSGILFWMPVIVQEPLRPRWPAWTAIPYLLFADIINTALSAFFIFSGKVLYPSYRDLNLGLLSPVDDQSLAGALMWVPGSIIYLIPATVFAMRLLSTHTARVPRLEFRHVPARPSRSVARRLLPLRRPAQVTMLAVAIVVCWHGFAGPQIASLNLAGVLPWIYWRALSVGALLMVGNLFCLSCPFTLVRDWARRILPAATRRWPHALRSKWLPAGIFVLYLWAYEAFSLWDKPFATAGIIAGYFLAAIAVDGFFRGASFCKYVCPIGQFHFVTSLISPREVRVRKAEICNSCQTHDCIRGNASARGCELYLFQPKKESNLDCTFCLDCVKACPHDNVSLLPVLPAQTLLTDSYRSGIGRLSKRGDYAALALVVVFGAFVNAAGMTTPVMMREHRLHAFLGAGGMPIAVAIFTVIGAVLLPWLVVTFAGGRELRNRLIFALVPVGVAMWAAHIFFHLGFGGIAPLQILMLDAGVLGSLYLAWRAAGQRWRTWLPWAVVCLGLYIVGVWTLLQPMTMRGMVHG